MEFKSNSKLYEILFIPCAWWFPNENLAHSTTQTFHTDWGPPSSEPPLTVWLWINITNTRKWRVQWSDFHRTITSRINSHKAHPHPCTVPRRHEIHSSRSRHNQDSRDQASPHPHWTDAFAWESVLAQNARSLPLSLYILQTESNARHFNSNSKRLFDVAHTAAVRTSTTGEGAGEPSTPSTVLLGNPKFRGNNILLAVSNIIQWWGWSLVCIWRMCVLSICFELCVDSSLIIITFFVCIDNQLCFYFLYSLPSWSIHCQ